jgi:ABC-2 type transport system ATP-binding protein
LRGVDLALQAGQSLALLGPNGGGKSTLLRLVVGTLPLQQGRIEIFGRPVDARARGRLGVVFQSTALDPQLTVGENLMLQGRLFGLDRRAALSAIDRELQRAGLNDRRRDPVRTLSGGLARRVDLGRALLHRPDVLILDEPTVGLDPVARRSFLDELEHRRAEDGLTVLMTTHLIDEADRHERVMMLHQGTVIAEDAPAKLRRQLALATVTVLDRAWRPPEADGDQWDRTATGWSLRLQEGQALPGDLTAGLLADGVPFSAAPPTLGDVFEHLTGARLWTDASTADPGATDQTDPETGEGPDHG